MYQFSIPPHTAGTGTGDDELLAIAGDANNVFHVAEFDLLDGKLGLGLGLRLTCFKVFSRVTVCFI